ncbi:MAG: glycosyltransferase family 4 protein [bacterium]
MPKKILFLTPRLPFPPISGGVLKTLKMLKYLCKHYNVTLAALLKDDDNNNLTAFFNEVEPHDYFFYSFQRERSFKNYVTSLLYKLPLSIYRNYSKHFQKKVTPFFSNIDIVIVDHFLMVQYIPENFKGKVILHQHNAEHVMWERYAQNFRWPLKNIISFEAERIEDYERKICQKANHILAAPNDIQILNKLSPSANFIETLHLGDEQLLDRPKLILPEENICLFIGTLSWEANKDGLLWFVQNCWKEISQQVPQAKLLVAGGGGKQNEEICNVLSSFDNIDFLGFVEDLNPLYEKARVFVAPIRFGSGIKVKVINAMYRGLPVVTTSVGTEGIKTCHEKDILISDSEHDFVHSTCRLLEDNIMWNSISDESRSLMKNQYTWEKVWKKLEEAING